jgi:SnoaL-like domain
MDDLEGPMTSSTETRHRGLGLAELVDRAELTDLVARHSVWLDEGRFEESDRLFTEDVVVKSIRGQAHGIEELVALARLAHDRYAGTLHSKSNLVIEVDGDAASVRASDIAVFVIDDKTEAVAAGIHRYSARRTEDGWRFDRLEITPVALTEALGRAL